MNAWTPVYEIQSILISICSLLDDPGLIDPLVPEIAQTYCEDYELYCHNARTYTARYAFSERTETEITVDGGAQGILRSPDSTS